MSLLSASASTTAAAAAANGTTGSTTNNTTNGNNTTDNSNTTKPPPPPPPLPPIKRWYRFQRSIVGEQYHDTIRNQLDEYTKYGIPQNDTKIQIYELHGANNPSFVQLIQKGLLQKWKQQSANNSISFFTFTIVREPISWSLSAFHMMCATQGICMGPKTRTKITTTIRNDDNDDGTTGGGDNRTTSTTTTTITTEKYVSNATSLTDYHLAIQPNPQCGFLFKSGLPYHRLIDQWTYHPTPQECNEVLWNYMTTYMDWVGTTERFSDTMDLLNAMTGLNVSVQITNAIPQEERRLRRQDLDTNTTIKERAIAMNALDTALYRRVQSYYTMDMWDIQEPLPLSFF